MRPGEFWEAWMAYQKEKQTDRRHIGELIRGVGLRLFNIQLRKKDQIRDPAKWWRMPWDEEANREEEIVRKLNHLSDEERSTKALELLNKLGWHQEQQ